MYRYRGIYRACSLDDLFYILRRMRAPQRHETQRMLDALVLDQYRRWYEGV